MFYEKLNDSNRKYVKATANGKTKYFLWQAFLTNWHSGSANNVKLQHNWTAPFSQNSPPVDMRSFLEVVIRLLKENDNCDIEVKAHYKEFFKTTIEAFIAGAQRHYREETGELIHKIKTICLEKSCSELFNRLLNL